MIGKFERPENLFELHDYSNYRSSDYMSSTVFLIPIFPLSLDTFIFFEHNRIIIQLHLAMTTLSFSFLLLRHISLLPFLIFRMV